MCKLLGNTAKELRQLLEGFRSLGHPDLIGRRR